MESCLRWECAEIKSLSLRLTLRLEKKHGRRHIQAAPFKTIVAMDHEARRPWTATEFTRLAATAIFRCSKLRQARLFGPRTSCVSLVVAKSPGASASRH